MNGIFHPSYQEEAEKEQDLLSKTERTRELFSF
jgi:hypothetical protein